MLKNQCMKCRRFNCRPFQLADMANLPFSKVRQSYPFQHVAVDVAEPIKMKDKEKPTKVWFYLCLGTKAIHLELALDLSASEFLQIFFKIQM